MLTQQELLKHLHYDPDTGIFTRLTPYNNRTKCGYTLNGYIAIGLNYKVYLAHRLAWLYMVGEWPLLEIDHIDANRANNRWSNLREVTRSQNQMNRRKLNPKQNTPVKGVRWNSQRNKWQATISSNNTRYHLGLFSTVEEAIEACQKKRQQLHGQYARFG